MKAAWCNGSVRGLPAQTLTIAGGPQVIPAGSYYLWDKEAPPCLIGQVRLAMVAAAVAGASVILMQNRKVKISATGTFALTWPVDGVLRRLLGFDGNLSGTNTYTAESISPLIWSSGRTETPTMAPLGSLGHTRSPVFAAVSPLDGSISVVSHGSGRTFNQFNFNMVANARYQTKDQLNGEFCVWFAEVCARGANFQLLRLVDEIEAGTDAIDPGQVLGPYVFSPGRDGIDWAFNRSSGGNFSNTDRRHDVQLPVHVVPEYVN
jgi:hypothetical protein